MEYIVIMSEYRRARVKGGLYCFTVVTYHRKNILCTETAFARLRHAFAYVKTQYPFQLKAWVILPDHLHCIWQLPENDADFSVRWRMLKRYFSIGFNHSSNHRREKLIWQRRFWEHVIRDQADYMRCLNYIHYNPVKHGYVTRARDWHYSSFLHYVSKGYYDLAWGSCDQDEPRAMQDVIRE